MTHDQLAELLDDVPRHVRPDIRAAWRSGTRRRQSRYAAGTAAALALGVLVGVAVVGFDPTPRVQPADDGGLTGYPSELPRPLGLTKMSDKPGPMAGVLVMDGIANVAVVDSHGRLWRVPDVSPWEDERPALSSDGRMLGYLSEVDDRRSEYVMLDLVTGRRTSFPGVGDGRLTNDVPKTDQPYFTSGQAPGFWSPDNRWLAVHGSAHEDPKPGPLLLGADGQVRELGVGTWPVGWFGPDRLAVLTAAGQLKTVDVDSGEVLTRVDLRIRTPFKVFGQWAAALSPDRDRIAVRASTDDLDTVFVFYTHTGTWATQMWQDDEGPCQLQWQGNERVLTWDRDLGLIDASSTQQVVTPSSAWGELPCATFVTDALRGQPQDGPGLTEWRYWGVLWAWEQILGGLVVIALVGGAIHLDRRGRRRRGQPT